MYAITVRVHVDDNLTEVVDTSNLMEALGGLVEGQTKIRITSEKRSPDGSPWAANSPLTVAAKGSSSVLQDTGRLAGSITHTSSFASAHVSTSVPYAPYMQYGVPKIVPKSAKFLAVPVGGGYVFLRSSSIPARPFMGISSENLSEIDGVVRAWAQGIFQ